MSLDLIALGLLLVFTALGAWRGVLASGAGLVSLVLSYVGAVLGAQHFGGWVAERFDVAEMIGSVVAASAAFLLTFVACSGIGWALKVWDRSRRLDAPRSMPDRLGGALFGFVRGGLIVLLISVMLSWLDAARDLGVLDGLSGIPQASGSRTGEASARLIEGVASAAIGDEDSESAPAAKLMIRVAARPSATLQSVQALLDDERVHAVQNDKLFWTLVENGAGERAINQLSFYQIVHDPELRHRLADLGMVSESAADDPEVFRGAMADMLSELGPKLKGLRNDPELRRLAEDPEILAMLESGDTMGLMTHPEIRRIVARVSESQP